VGNGSFTFFTEGTFAAIGTTGTVVTSRLDHASASPAFHTITAAGSLFTPFTNGLAKFVAIRARHARAVFTLHTDSTAGTLGVDMLAVGHVKPLS
jgi:hypothetical protein